MIHDDTAAFNDLEAYVYTYDKKKWLKSILQPLICL